MSEIRANTVSDAAGTGPATLTGQYAAKAWVSFNGTGTVAIRESGNVSSITDEGTGRYGVNFATAMSDANYCVHVSSQQTNNNVSQVHNIGGPLASSSVSFQRRENNINYDSSYIHVTAHR